jgi:esterase
MKLFFRKYGSGQPLIIMHGLFGQSDNWNTLSKQFADASTPLSMTFEVYAVDMRNHGLSPWSEQWNYKAMSEDILELINDNNLQDPILLGHSMGGKAAMQFAIDHPGKLSKLIVVDIAPKNYPPHHDGVIEGLLSCDLSVLKTRKEVEEQLSKFIKDFGTKQFLLKNLYWKTETQLAWRFNLEVLSKDKNETGRSFEMQYVRCDVPSLFVRGELSKYILDEDELTIETIFPNVRFATIHGAGHWVHAEKPKEFFEEVMKFIS